MMGFSKRFVMILSLILMLSVTLNVVQLVLRTKEHQNIIGTYCTGNSISESDEYLVFERDGAYSHYQQFLMIERSKYTAQDEPVYALTRIDNEESIQIFIWMRPFTYLRGIG